ncbi:MAG: NACHT domain-containing protein [Bacteroidetes bacterium]|nr:NACHT domain-containing protein [Bacteroidota bacterium]
MEEKLLETFVGAFVSELVNQSKELVNEFGDEAKQLLNRGVKKYLDKQKEKYSHLKTLLRGNTPVYIYDIYYSLKIENDDDEVFETKNITDIFKKSNYVTLIGDAGSGKSTLVKHLFLNSIYLKAGIPILIELRYLNEYNDSLESFIIEKIFENKLTENIKILNRLLEQGKFTFFLDGYDELTKENKQKIIKNINSFVNQYDKNRFILTTRPYSDIEHLPLFHNYFIKGLDYENKEIEGFIYKQLPQEIEVAQKIISSINSNQSEYITSFLTNPLLLTLYILTFQSNASIPDRKYIFYRRVINALFSEHDSKTKLGFVRQKQSSLTQEQFEEILKAYCFLSYFEGRYNWDYDYVVNKLQTIKGKLNLTLNNNFFINDLKSAIALWVDDNGQMAFAHRSLQEYFSALFIQGLNSVENKRIYEKIIDRFAKVRRLNEIENFLSLCEEMDTLNFKRYYYLPLLKDLRQTINGQNLREKALAFLKFFATGINTPPEPKKRMLSEVDINDELVYKSIYIHLPFTIRLNQILREIVLNREIDHCNGLVEKELDISNRKRKITVKHLSLRDNVPDDFFEVCYPKIYHVTKELDEFLDKKMIETELYINKSLDQDKELVDLI